MYKFAFWSVAHGGRKFGGILPGRMVHWMVRRAYPNVPSERDYRWIKDRWGNELKLHPYYFIDWHVIAYGGYELPLGRYLTKHLKPGMVVFDVGANIGTVSVLMGSRVGPTGAVHAFEPIDHLHRRLVENIERNHLDAWTTPHKLALGNLCGEQEIALPAEHIDNQGRASLVNKQDDLPMRQTVAIRTLDAFVEEHRIGRIDLIKMDIQGAEPLMLDGGRETLKRMQPPLLIEIESEELKAGGSSSRELVESLLELGYDLHEINRWGEKAQPVSLTDIGEDYIARQLLASPRNPNR